MRRTFVTLGVLVALAVLATPRDAAAFRLRLGGYSVVEPETDSKFTIGIDNDMRFIPYLGLNYGLLWSVDGDSMFSDLYLGLKVFFPLGLDDKLWLDVRGNFLLKWAYIFDDVPEDNGLALGGVVGPGILYELGPVSLSFDLDVQIYSFVWPDAFEQADTQVALVYTFGVGF